MSLQYDFMNKSFAAILCLLLAAHRADAQAIRGDVNDPEQCAALVQTTLETYGQIDALVNNAGGTLPAPALKLKDETFVDAFKFNRL